MSSSNRKAAVLSQGKAGTLVRHSYGKSRVRLTKVSRRADRHDLMELSVDVNLEGEFDETYTTGSNKSVVATDSMKNTVYVLAARNDLTDIESFAKTLSAHFLKQYSHVNSATVSIEEDLWRRIEVDGKPHAHSFYGAGGEKRTCSVHATRERTEVRSGISNLRVVKTTDSAFVGFIRDEYTTLAEVKDRIFGTTVTADWLYEGDGEPDFDQVYDRVRSLVLEGFAEHMSDSVQQTLFDIGQAAIGACVQIAEITITMPNQHRIPFDLKPFGMENRNEIFVTTDEPYGLISATIGRN